MKRIALVCIFLVLIITIPAQAPEGDFYLKARHSDKCLQIDWSLFPNGANVAQRKCTEKSDRVFEKISAGPVYFLLRSKSTQKCLQLSEDSKEDGVNVTQWECQNFPRFKWRQVPSLEKGYFYIINQYSDKCLHVEDSSPDEGANIVQWDCSDQSQSITQWQFESYSSAMTEGEK